MLNFSHSFKITFLNIVAVFSCFARYVRCSFFNVMSMLYPVRAMCWPSDSGCGDAEISKFISCVDKRDPKVNAVWILDEDVITPEVHPTARVGVNAGIFCKFATN